METESGNKSIPPDTIFAEALQGAYTAVFSDAGEYLDILVAGCDVLKRALHLHTASYNRTSSREEIINAAVKLRQGYAHCEQFLEGYFPQW